MYADYNSMTSGLRMPGEQSYFSDAPFLPPRTLEIRQFEDTVDLSYLSTPHMQIGECEITFPYGVISGLNLAKNGLAVAIDTVGKPIANAIWKYGFSHRNFPTGGVGFGTASYLEPDQLLVVWAVNQKPLPGIDPDRACHEETNLEKLRILRAKRARAIINYAETQADDFSGIAEDALPTCGNCRKVFIANPLVDKDTVVVSRNPNTKREIRRTVGRLMKVYGETWENGRFAA